MEDENIFFDYTFFENHENINDNNIFDYFKRHPEYDRNSLNEKNEYINQQNLIKNKGIFYVSTKINSNYYLIKKYHNANNNLLLIEVYMIINNLIINSINYKEIMKNKIKKIINQMDKIIYHN